MPARSASRGAPGPDERACPRERASSPPAPEPATRARGPPSKKPCARTLASSAGSTATSPGPWKSNSARFAAAYSAIVPCRSRWSGKRFVSDGDVRRAARAPRPPAAGTRRARAPRGRPARSSATPRQQRAADVPAEVDAPPPAAAPSIAASSAEVVDFPFVPVTPSTGARTRSRNRLISVVTGTPRALGAARAPGGRTGSPGSPRRGPRPSSSASVCGAEDEPRAQRLGLVRALRERSRARRASLTSTSAPSATRNRAVSTPPENRPSPSTSARAPASGRLTACPPGGRALGRLLAARVRGSPCARSSASSSSASPSGAPAAAHLARRSASRCRLTVSSPGGRAPGSRPIAAGTPTSLATEA